MLSSKSAGDIMQDTFKKIKRENIILTSFVLIAIAIFAAVRYDFYYALNDDVLIKDIISGGYTGIPESRNYQMLYPLSLLFSLLYKVLPGVLWYGLFEYICHFGCLFLIVYRSLSLCRSRNWKYFICILQGLGIIGFFLEHLVLAQYTITSGLLAATAIFLFVTQKENNKLIQKSIPSICLAILACLLRSEMLLLMLPFICIAGIYRWSCETQIFIRDNFKKYLSVIGCILVGIVLVLVIDEVAYSENDWKDFRTYFNARTNLYDYTGIPIYEQNESFYKENGISEVQYELLQNYNYGLDESINTEFLNKVSAYADEIQESLLDRVKLGMVRYRYRITNMDGYPYCLLVILGYILFALSVTRKNKWRMAFVVAILFSIRSVVWIYILMTNRIPARITHPLYFAEFILLLAICIAEFLKAEYEKRQLKFRIGSAIFLSILVFGYLAVGAVKTTDVQFQEVVERNRANKELQAYCEANNDDFYFMDVYSSIYFTERVFEKNVQACNYELLGGWICNSPLYYKKLGAYGMESVERAFLEKDNVYLVQNAETSFDWLIQYYSLKGYQVAIQEVERFDDWLGVYEINISK